MVGVKTLLGRWAALSCSEVYTNRVGTSKLLGRHTHWFLCLFWHCSLPLLFNSFVGLKGFSAKLTVFCRRMAVLVVFILLPFLYIQLYAGHLASGMFSLFFTTQLLPVSHTTVQ